MALTVTGNEHELTRLWADALAPLVVRHPNRMSTPQLSLIDGPTPTLVIQLDRTPDTRDPNKLMHQPFTISNVRLTFFPGTDLAQKWFAAGWAGYCQHEALEMVTIGHAESPLDPHAEPYETNPYNRGLRDGFPSVLDLGTMIDALAVVMHYEAALEIAGGGR